MIFRVTNKLGKRIKCLPEDTLEKHVNPFLDWGCTTFVADRRHYILLTHSNSILSCAFPAKGITNATSFADRSGEVIEDCLNLYGFEFAYDTFICPSLDDVQFSKVGDRKLNGIMVDLVYNAKVQLLEVGIPWEMLTIRLNEIPQCSRDNVWPVDAFKNLLANPKN